MASPSKSLKVAVLGPKGQCGQCVVDELLSRGHDVVGLSRSPPKAWPNASAHGGSYEGKAVNINDISRLAEAFSGDFDAIVCAFAPPLSDMANIYENGVEGHAKIKTALLASEHKGSFIVIGGAGSLHGAGGQQLVDTPNFAYSWWYNWPDEHLNYMRVRMSDHSSTFLSWFIRGFRWARNNVEKPGWFSWTLRPLAWMYLRWAKGILTSSQSRGLITISRMALVMWEGVRDKQWSFLSPPGLLRDKGVRTGEYKLFIDTPEDPAVEAIEEGIYNEDMAVAIVDEVQNNHLAFKHWSCTGPIGLREW